MPTAETTFTIQRNGATQNAADNKLEAANIRFVTSLVPNVREVEILPAPTEGGQTWAASEYDFYLRDETTGAVLLTQGGKDRIRANALTAAAVKLLRKYHRAVVDAQIEREEKAANLLALQAKIAADD